VLLLGISGYLGGVSATSLFPTTVETSNYSAQLRLSALPTLTSTIHSPTSFGDIDLDFGSLLPAPGVDATVQIRENITGLFDERRISIDSLQPSGEEISAALGSAIWQVGVKFAAGTFFVTIVGLGLLAYGRRRPPTRRQVVAATVTGLAIMGGTGLGIAESYQPDHLTSFTTTGLLGTVRRNAGLFGEVEARAQQATPYVRNLLALSQALQAKFVPEDLNQPTAARLLLVSDIHGANQYPVMKQIVGDEQIDAVIDSGDLLNFGSITEAEAAGIFNAIQDLGVPYVFVRGNHDASSADDQALLQRMARIPNVVLLQPKPDEYTQATVNGISIAGFNDPRFFGDDNKHNAAEQKPSAEAFNRTFKNRDRPDVVVSHEPAAVRLVESAGILVNGHLHKDELEDNRIGVGTFTGGGTVSHFVEDSEKRDPGSEGGELAGQPYAFDIAVFGERCAITSLTRYTYRNLIEGRPAYDDVTVVNGTTIGKPPGPDRTCNAERGMTKSTVTAPATGGGE